MSSKREKRLSALGLVVARGILENDLHFPVNEISFEEMQQLQGRFDWIVFCKAYQSLILADRDYDEMLTLKDALGIVTLDVLSDAKHKRSRESVLELLNTLGIKDSETFLINYETIKDAYWVSEAEVGNAA